MVVVIDRSRLGLNLSLKCFQRRLHRSDLVLMDPPPVSGNEMPVSLVPQRLHNRARLQLPQQFFPCIQAGSVCQHDERLSHCRGRHCQRHHAAKE